MAIKLLAKSAISKLQAADKQREVDEGLKLARRVDTLREVVSQEDASLQKFRSETLSAIQAEITDHTTKRDALKNEVVGLETRRAAALEPLASQIQEIKDNKTRLSFYEDELDEKSKVLYAREGDSDEREREIAEREKQTTYAHIDAQERLQKADTLKNEAERTNSIANQTLVDAQIKASSLLADAEQRKEWVTQRETAVSVKEEELRTKEIDLAKQFSVLKDREATLARNIKRNGN